MAKKVIALGFFDGVHIGHGALLRRTRELAKELGLEPAAISFDAPPAKSVELITSSYDRRELISRLYGIDDVIMLHFDESLRKMDWESFIDRLTVDLDAGYLVAGYDFRFGYMGLGDAEKLKKHSDELGIGCEILGKVTLDGVTVSSTRIRELISAGEMEEALRFLGHPYSLSDSVRHGRRLGRTLGFPTVNLRFSPGVLVPKYGVYAAYAHLPEGESLPSVANIGVKPTVADIGEPTVEANIMGYSGDLYGKTLRLDFYRFIRPERKFPDLESLRAQIAEDTEEVKKYLNNIVTSGQY